MCKDTIKGLHVPSFVFHIFLFTVFTVLAYVQQASHESTGIGLAQYLWHWIGVIQHYLHFPTIFAAGTDGNDPHAQYVQHYLHSHTIVDAGTDGNDPYSP